jgi:hypothetical protein
MREIERDEHDRRGPDDGDGEGVLAGEDGGQHEPHEDRQADGQAGERGDATTTSEHDDGGHEQRAQPQHGSATREVGEVVGRAARVDAASHHDPVADRQARRARALAEHDRCAVALVGPVLDRQGDVEASTVVDGILGFGGRDAGPAAAGRASDDGRVVELGCRPDQVRARRRMRRPQVHQAHHHRDKEWCDGHEQPPPHMDRDDGRFAVGVHWLQRTSHRDAARG